MSAPGTTRRSLCAGTALLAVDLIGVGALAGAIAEHSADAEHLDAELIAACAQHPITMAALNARTGGKLCDDDDPLWKAYSENRDIISDAEPQTMEGILAKARAAVVENAGDEQCFTGMDQQWSWDIVKDVLRLAGFTVPPPRVRPEVERAPAPVFVFPDADLLHASTAFLGAEQEYIANCWAEDAADKRTGDRAAALARFEAANAMQEDAARVMVSRRATTLAGFQSKAKVAVAWYGDRPPNEGLGAEVLWSLAQDLARDDRA
jgi:hypothetical protein